MDIPLCNDGSLQAAEMAQQLSQFKFDAVYAAPCRSARQTAEMIADTRRLKVKVIDELHNVDHGLWHGKLIDEVKQTQPRLYRQGQEHAESICPPQGEPIAAGRERVRRSLSRILKKHRTGELCLVAPEPLASVIGSELQHSELTDLWKIECDNGGWNAFDITIEPGPELGFRGIVAGPLLAAASRERRVLTAKGA